ncbi:MAG: hypothetical protein AB1397_00775 [bacterium]
MQIAECGMKAWFKFSLFSLLSSVFCCLLSASGVSHYTIGGGYTLSQALDLEKRKLYLGGTSQQAIMIISLDEQGMPEGEPFIYPTEANCLSMAIYNDKLYVGNNQDAYLYIYNLDKNGLIFGTPTKAVIATEGMGAYSIALDPERRKLYVGNMSGGNNLCVYSLDKNGLPIGEPHLFTASGYTTSIALNPIHNKLYLAGYGGENPFVCDLKNDGSLSGGGWSFGFGNLTYSLALDIERKRLYLANNSANDLSVVKLLDDGLPSTYTLYSFGGPSISLSLDKRKNKLYVGKNQAGNNLYVYSLDKFGDIKGTPTVFKLGGPTFSLCLGENLYLGNYSGANNLSILKGDEMSHLLINQGTNTTSTQDIEISLSSPNPHWIKVSGDIEAIYEPKIKLNQWVAVSSCKKIKARLTPKNGKKRIVFYFLSSAGFGNYTAVLKRKEASIFLDVFR